MTISHDQIGAHSEKELVEDGSSDHIEVDLYSELMVFSELSPEQQQQAAESFVKDSVRQPAPVKDSVRQPAPASVNPPVSKVPTEPLKSDAAVIKPETIKPQKSTVVNTGGNPSLLAVSMEERRGSV